MPYDAETILRAKFPKYRREAEERDRLREEERRRQLLDAANGKTELGLGITVQAPEIAPCKGVPLHAKIAPKPDTVRTSPTPRPPRSRDFLILGEARADKTVQVLDKEEEGNICTKQNEPALVLTSPHADEGNWLLASGDEDNTPARSPTHDAGEDKASSCQLEEEVEITASTPASPAPAEYPTPSEFAEDTGIISIRCQLYDNDKLGDKSKKKSRYVVKTTINYDGGKRDIWFLRLLTEPRFFWRKTKREGLSAVDAEMLAGLERIKAGVRKTKTTTVIKPVIGRLYLDHDVQTDCSGILAQAEGEVPIVWLNLHGTIFDIAIATASKGSARCAADCGIGYWNARASKKAAGQ